MPTDATSVEVERAIDLAVLARFAIEHGALETDPVAQQSLSEHMRALGLSLSGSERVKLASRLGLPSVDPLLHARLAFQGDLLLRHELKLPKPDEEALKRYFREHSARYERPARVDVLQAFVSNAHGADERTKKLEQMRLLFQRGSPFAEVAALSDASTLPRSLKGVTARDLDKWFGPGFGAAVLSLSPHELSAPVASSFGVHLVWVSRRTQGGAPALAEVRNRVEADLVEDLQGEAIARARVDLRRRYEIKIRRGVTP